MKRFNVCKTAECPPIIIPGTSQTIPGLAPDLQTLLAAAQQGEPLPRIGVPMFDESEEEGVIRVQVEDLPPEDILHAHETAKATPEQPSVDPEVSASSNEQPEERSDGESE